MKKYKLRKKSYINAIVILIFLLVATGAINIGYSLWSSKLNIFGKVTLDLEVPNLEISILQKENGRYTNIERTK